MGRSSSRLCSSRLCSGCRGPSLRCVYRPNINVCKLGWSKALGGRPGTASAEALGAGELKPACGALCAKKYDI